MTAPRSENAASRHPVRVLVMTAWFEPGFRGGGPIRSLARIVDSVSDAVDLLLVTTDRDAGDTRPYAGLAGLSWRGRSAVYYLDTASVVAWLHLLGDLRRRRFDLLYLNSLFGTRFTLVPLVAARLGLIRVDRFLLAPRGELSPGALALKRRKKRAFLAVAKRLLKFDRLQWHASSPDEAAHIRAAFPTADVLVAANQTSLPARSMRQFSIGDDATMVFVSRICAKKNLDLVLRALGGVTRPASLDVYGPIEDGEYWARCVAIIESLPPWVRVTYRGELAPGEVRSAFSQYDAFVFPTRGENFGHVIAESLSVGCPVFCSADTPWTTTLAQGGGRVLRDQAADTLTRELQELCATSPEARLAMRENAADAYDRWRDGVDEVNILDEWCRRRVMEPAR